MWNSVPARSSWIVPSSIAAVAQPESTMPTCSTLQGDAPTRGPTCTDHFHPGSYVARPMVMPPIRTSSNFPFSNVRTSSGSSKRFKTVSSVPIVSPTNRIYTQTGNARTAKLSLLMGDSPRIVVVVSCRQSPLHYGNAKIYCDPTLHTNSRPGRCWRRFRAK
jgi:hypothetical protein